MCFKQTCLFVAVVLLQQSPGGQGLRCRSSERIEEDTDMEFAVRQCVYQMTRNSTQFRENNNNHNNNNNNNNSGSGSSSSYSFTNLNDWTIKEHRDSFGKRKHWRTERDLAKIGMDDVFSRGVAEGRRKRDMDDVFRRGDAEGRRNEEGDGPRRPGPSRDFVRYTSGRGRPNANNPRGQETEDEEQYNGPLLFDNPRRKAMDRGRPHSNGQQTQHDRDQGSPNNNNNNNNGRDQGSPNNKGRDQGSPYNNNNNRDQGSPYNNNNGRDQGSPYNNRPLFQSSTNNNNNNDRDQGSPFSNRPLFQSSSNNKSSFNNNNYNNNEESALARLEPLDDHGHINKQQVLNKLTNNIREHDLRDFLQFTVEECFEEVEERNRGKYSTREDGVTCKGAQILALCLEERGRQACDDWEDPLQQQEPERKKEDGQRKKGEGKMGFSYNRG